MKYVGLVALAGTFWLLVATVRVAINEGGQPQRDVVKTDSPVAEQRPVAPVDPKLWPGTNCDLPNLDHVDRTLDDPYSHLSKAAVVAGMNAVKPLVNACYLQYQVRGMAMVNVVINKDGSVCSAAATGKFAGTPIGACVEQAVRTARFPPSSDGLVTPYPFALR